jgi:hypothetical protein
MRISRVLTKIGRGARKGSRRAVPHRESVVAISAAQDDPDRFSVIESCHSTWLFDTVDRRFCRVLRAGEAPSSVATDWRPYDRLVVEDGTDAFIVILDASGTRLLRSWRHSQHCEHCGADNTAELSLEDLRKVARA